MAINTIDLRKSYLTPDGRFPPLINPSNYLTHFYKKSNGDVTGSLYRKGGELPVCINIDIKFLENKSKEVYQELPKDSHEDVKPTETSWVAVAPTIYAFEERESCYDTHCQEEQTTFDESEYWLHRQKLEYLRHYYPGNKCGSEEETLLDETFNEAHQRHTNPQFREYYDRNKQKLNKTEQTQQPTKPQAHNPFKYIVFKTIVFVLIFFAFYQFVM